MKSLRSALRVSVALALLASVGAIAQPALPYANAEGYATTLVVVNPTDEPIGQVIEDRVYPPLVHTYAPHSVTRTASWPRQGVGVELVGFAAGLEVYTEIRTLLGTIVRVAPLVPVPLEAAFYDLPTDSTFESHVFVAAPAGDGIFRIVTSDGRYADQTIAGPGAVLIPVSDSYVRVLAGTGPVYPVLETGPLYTFAIVVHDVTGAITTVSPHLR